MKSKKILICLVSIFLIVRFYLSLTRIFDGDEFVNLHASWCIWQGQIPYKDFKHIYFPLFWYVNLPLFWIFGETVNIVDYARILIFFINIFIFILVYKISCRIFNQKIGLYSVFLLGVCGIFLKKGIEVRPDILTVFLGLLSFYLFLKHNVIFSGILAGLGILSIQKGAIFVIPIILVLLIERNFKNLFIFLFFCMLPVIGLFIYFKFFLNSLDYLLNHTIYGVTKYQKLFTFWYGFINSFIKWDTIFWISGLIGFVLELKNFKDKKKLFLLVTCGIFILSIVFAPFPYYQYYLPLLPFIAIFGASFITKLKNPLLYLSILIIICQSANTSIKETKQTSTQQKKIIKFVLESTTKEEKIFDGWAGYIFRPHLYPWYHIASGLVNTNTYDEIPYYLYKYNCRIIIGTGLINELKPNIVQFISQNYIYSGRSVVYLAGKNFEFKKPGIYEFELIYNGEYIVDSKQIEYIEIDNQRLKVGDRIFLKKGKHRISVNRIQNLNLMVYFPAEKLKILE